MTPWLGYAFLMAMLVLPGVGWRALAKPRTRCPSFDCGHRNQANARYCARCGRVLPGGWS